MSDRDELRDRVGDPVGDPVDDPVGDPVRWRDDDEAPPELQALFRAVPPPLPREVRARVRAELVRKTRGPSAAIAPLLWVAGLAAAIVALALWQWPRFTGERSLEEGPLTPFVPEPVDAGPVDAEPSETSDAGPPPVRDAVPWVEVAGNGCGLDLLLSLDRVDEDVASVALVLAEPPLHAEGEPAHCEGEIVLELPADLFGSAPEGRLALPLEVLPPATRCGASYTVTVCVRDAEGRLSTHGNVWRTSTSDRELSRTGAVVATPSGPVSLSEVAVGHAITALVAPRIERPWSTPGSAELHRVEARVLRRDEVSDEDGVDLRFEDGRVAELYGSTPVWTRPSDGVDRFVAARELRGGDLVRGERDWRRVETVVTNPELAGPSFDVTWPDTLFIDDVLVRDVRASAPSETPESPMLVEPLVAIPARNWECSLRVDLVMEALPETASSVALVYQPHRGRSGRRIPVDCSRASVGVEVPVSLLRRVPALAGHPPRLSLTLPAWDSEMRDWHPSDDETPPRGRALDCDRAYAVLACAREADGSLHASPDAEGRWARTGPACFAGGTLVRTPAGELPIERLARGARVSSRDAQGNTIEVVVQALVPRGERPVIALELSNGTRLVVTAEHPLFDARAAVFRPAGELHAGDLLSGSDGGLVEILVREDREETVPVYDLSVGAPHAFFAGGVLVHNY